ncbi:MAG: hypothetical protein QY304_03470 [Candidatus Paceibacterota bacterium]|nr:MAG: hypothetical protein QY304_03470 [Candidatus Paceibacterota bacterium]
MSSESIKPSAGEEKLGQPISEEGLETPETLKTPEKPSDVIATIEGVNGEVVAVMNSAYKRVEGLGGDPNLLRDADQKLSAGMEAAKNDFLREFVDAAPDVLRARVNEVASLLATINEPSAKDLEREFALDPETAKVYFTLASAFNSVSEKTRAENIENSKEEITPGSLVTRQGWSEPGKVWKIENGQAFIEGVANSVPLDDLSLFEEKIAEPETQPVNDSTPLETVEVKNPTEQEFQNREVTIESETPPVVETKNAEIPKSVLKQLSPDNRNLIQKLPEKTWNFLRDKILTPPIFATKLIASRISHKALRDAGEVHLRYGFIGSRVGTLFNSVLIDREKTGWIRYGTTLEGIQQKFDKTDEIAKEYESQIAELDRQERELSAQGTLSSSERLKIEHVRERINRKLEQVRNKRNALSHRSEEVGARISRYENRRQVISENLIKRVESRLKPLESRMEKIKSAKQKLEAETQELKRAVEERQARLEDLKARMSANPNLKSVLKPRSKEISAIMKKAEKLIEYRQTKIRDFDRQISFLVERLNPYDEMRSKFQGFMKSPV